MMRKLESVPMAASDAVEQLPDDPRARQVLRQLRERPRSRTLLSAPRLARSKSVEQAAWLYWMLRIAHPERVLVVGCPAPGDLITLAAAVADSGGRRVQCLSDVEPSSKSPVRGLVAAAGLDWLLHFSDQRSIIAFEPDALVVAGNEPGQFELILEQLDRATGPRLVIGLGHALKASGELAATLRDRLRAQGFRLLLPEATPPSLWAALARDGRV